ncbi:hypothetical protein QFZ49_005745 [Streptomyces turgidiscabies]|uniref:SH3b domain-containing protein n=1 Tax=Streptomyces turgidiscabies TaxID=85558 RepID=A0ABU0RVQ6_9ACTN|nr:hypothetical protein [Streptomyces turgidiscabies]
MRIDGHGRRHARDHRRSDRRRPGGPRRHGRGPHPPGAAQHRHRGRGRPLDRGRPDAPPVGTSYGKAYTDVGRLTRSLNVPGGVRPTGKWYGTWSEHVNVRRDPSTANPPMTQLPAGVEVLVGCQKKGQTVSVPPYTNDWWAYLPQYGGYISNIYISSPDNRLPDVPDCAGS